MNTNRLFLNIALIAIATLFAGCATFVAREEQVWIPAKDRSENSSSEADIRLEGTLYLPEGNGPFPVLIFNHGTASINFSPSRTVKHPDLANIVAEHGVALLIPMRRGRGSSGGTRSDFTTCDTPRSTLGIRHGIQDIDAAVAFVSGHPKLNASQLLLGGQSRGALLASVYAGERPKQPIQGVLNFAGAWMATWACTDFTFGAFKHAGSKSKVPTLFIYGEDDSQISNSAQVAIFDSFVLGGGNGILKIYKPRIGYNGHYLVNEYKEAWENDVHEFLAKIGYPRLKNKP